jgi:hypothetical protein
MNALFRQDRLEIIAEVSFSLNPSVSVTTGSTLMKLHLTNAEVGMWNAEGWSRFAQSFFIK